MLWSSPAEIPVNCVWNLCPITFNDAEKKVTCYLLLWFAHSETVGRQDMDWPH